MLDLTSLLLLTPHSKLCNTPTPDRCDVAEVGYSEIVRVSGDPATKSSLGLRREPAGIHHTRSRHRKGSLNRSSFRNVVSVSVSRKEINACLSLAENDSLTGSPFSS